MIKHQRACLCAIRVGLESSTIYSARTALELDEGNTDGPDYVFPISTIPASDSLKGHAAYLTVSLRTGARLSLNFAGFLMQSAERKQAST